MSQKYEWLYKTVSAEYNKLKQDVITWLGLQFNSYIEHVYQIELAPDEALVLTDKGLSQQMTGLGYGINLPGLPLCMVFHYYRPSLADDVLTGKVNESMVNQIIREFFRDYINYAKVWIANPCKFIKIKHKDLICSKPGKGAIATLSTLKLS